MVKNVDKECYGMVLGFVGGQIELPWPPIDTVVVLERKRGRECGMLERKWERVVDSGRIFINLRSLHHKYLLALSQL